MIVAYLDCFAGVAGDMFVGALLDAGVDLEELRSALAGLPLEGYEIDAEPVRRASIAGVKFHVRATRHEHAHRGLADIVQILDQAKLHEPVRSAAGRVFTRLAEAEARAHALPVEKVHFHEVGAVDAIVDVVASCWGLWRLGVERLFTSPVHLGKGSVACAHGIMPVPAPGAIGSLLGHAVILGGGPGERATPTGAALVGALAETAAEPITLRPRAIGYGAGERDTPDRPNLLRIIVGELDPVLEADRVVQLETNLDQVSGEVLGHLMESLPAAGALDVWVTPIQMKKSRPAWVLSVLCPEERRADLEERIFRETRTLGIRRSRMERSKLPRRMRSIETESGTVRLKERTLPDGTLSWAPEYDDVKRIAETTGRPFLEVLEEANQRARHLSGD